MAILQEVDGCLSALGAVFREERVGVAGALEIRDIQSLTLKATPARDISELFEVLSGVMFIKGNHREREIFVSLVMTLVTISKRCCHILEVKIGNMHNRQSGKERRNDQPTASKVGARCRPLAQSIHAR